jgi:hypothetical protein
MVLTLRPTGLQSPAYEDWADYSVYENGERVGRLFEDRAAGTQPELRWFWSITVVVDARAGVQTDGRTASFEEAKTQFHENWGRWKAWAKIAGRSILGHP